MAIHHDTNVFQSCSDFTKGKKNRLAVRPIVSINFRMVPHASVHENSSVWMVNEVAQAWLDLTGTGLRIFSWSHEVSKVNSSDCHWAHK